MEKLRRAASLRRHDVDMTEGSAFRHILYFAIPLLVGNLFQQLYNMVDTWVVGNYVSNEAFSAVGTVAPVINMLIGTFLGFSSGAGVVIAQHYGAGQYDKVRDATSTAITLTLILSVIFSVVGVLITPEMVRFMKTPESVQPESEAYLTIYFAGMAGLLFYNMCSGIMQAVGDSKRPFYYLVVSAVLNIVLDLLFVIVFDMGVKGVAYATVIAQAVSAILALVSLMRARSSVRVDLRSLRIEPQIMLKIIRVGIPASLQMAVTSFSNVFVQSYINYFGATCMGGWTAYSKLDQLVFMPMQSLAIAVTTFVGQNLGKGHIERTKQGIRTTLMMSFAATAVISVIVMVFAPQLVAFFNDEPDVVVIGTQFMRMLTPFYMLCCVNQIYSGALRGAGDSKAPMIIMLLSFVCFRQVYLYVVANFIANEIVPISMGYPAGWAVCSLLTFLYYRHANLGKNRLVDEQPA